MPTGPNVRPSGDPCAVPAEERIVRIRPTTVLAVLGITFGFLFLLYVTWISRQVLTWIVVAIFLTLALNPAVEAFERRGLRRGTATALTSLLALGVMVAAGSLFIPTLVDEATGFADELPEYVNDVSEGRGPLGEPRRTLRDRRAGARRRAGRQRFERPRLLRHPRSRSPRA